MIRFCIHIFLKMLSDQSYLQLSVLSFLEETPTRAFSDFFSGTWLFPTGTFSQFASLRCLSFCLPHSDLGRATRSHSRFPSACDFRSEVGLNHSSSSAALQRLNLKRCLDTLDCAFKNPYLNETEFFGAFRDICRKYSDVEISDNCLHLVPRSLKKKGYQTFAERAACLLTSFVHCLDDNSA